MCEEPNFSTMIRDLNICLLVGVLSLSCAMAQTSAPDTVEVPRYPEKPRVVLEKDGPSEPPAQYYSQIEQGDASYDYYELTKAIGHYQKAWKADTAHHEAKIKMARCYHLLNNSEQAVHWYGQVADNKRVFFRADKLYYAQALEQEKQYQLAQKWYKAYSKEVSNQDLAKNKRLSKVERSAFYQDSAYYKVVSLEANSPQSDFSPTYVDQGIVFVSARRGTSLLKPAYGWNDQAYLDLYYAPIDEVGQLGKVQALNKEVNSRYHEGPTAFYDSARKMIFTRNNYFKNKKGKSSQGVVHLQLFTATRTDTSMTHWEDIKPFPYNSEEYSVCHPSVTADGQKLFFVSDMPGGHGGTDVYVCQWENNTWSRPVNAGGMINTDGNELFPFIHSNGELYFASDGRAGLGGLDIYKIRWKKRQSAIPSNLGYPINTRHDDFGLILDKTEEQGFFSSTRGKDGVNDDLYHLYINRPKTVVVSGTVVDRHTKEKLPQARVKVEDKRRNIAQEVQTSADGSYTLELPWEATYQLVVNRDGFEEHRQSLTLEKESPQPSTLPLTRILRVYGTLKDMESDSPLEGIKLTLKDLETEEEQEQTTGNDGTYTFELQPYKEYEIAIRKRKFFNQVIVFDTKDPDERSIEIAPAVEEIVIGKGIKLDDIYYASGKWDIQPKAARELDKLVKMLKDNPTIEIELSSHTDARGSATSNITLSDRRAKSATDYIVSQGIAADRIVGKGYGEEKLINQCADGVNCSAEEHQQNRRTEFAVTKY